MPRYTPTRCKAIAESCRRPARDVFVGDRPVGWRLKHSKRPNAEAYSDERRAINMRKLLLLFLLPPALTFAQVGPGSPSHFLSPSNSPLGSYANQAALTAAWPAAQLSPLGGQTAFLQDGTGWVGWNGSAWVTTSSSGGGAGTVTSVSVASANGLAGTCATNTTTPNCTLSETVNGLLYGSGGALAAATAANVFGIIGGNFTGDISVSTAGAATVTGINGTQLSGLSTGPLKNTTGTGVPSIATSADILGLFPSSLIPNTDISGLGIWATSNDTTTGTGSVVVLSGSPAIIGTTAGTAPAAGVIGEVLAANCPSASTGTVTISIASPAVITWSAFPGTTTPAQGATGAPVNWTCPINFTTTGALPTGLAVGTNYWIIGSTYSSSGTTFEIADTASHAMGGTNAINTSGSQSGTQTGVLAAILANSTPLAGAGLSVSAGDWNCQALSEYNVLTAATATGYWGAFNSANTGLPSNPSFYVNVRTSSINIATPTITSASPLVQQNLASQTNLFAIADFLFSAGTVNGSGQVTCTRIR